MAYKRYTYRVVALGLEFADIERNIRFQRKMGWTLISTYVDRNRATVGQEPSVCGVFETWEKVYRNRRPSL
jgi:hypothetical protein